MPMSSWRLTFGHKCLGPFRLELRSRTRLELLTSYCRISCICRESVILFNCRALRLSRLSLELWFRDVYIALPCVKTTRKEHRAFRIPACSNSFLYINVSLRVWQWSVHSVNITCGTAHCVYYTQISGGSLLLQPSFN